VHKVHHAAVRIISWSLPWGLYVEHTDPFLARATEGSLVHLWGKKYWSFRFGDRTVVREMLPTISEEIEEDDNEEEASDDISIDIRQASGGIQTNAVSFSSDSSPITKANATSSDSDDETETDGNVDQDDSSSASDDQIMEDKLNNDEDAERFASSQDYQEEYCTDRSINSFSNQSTSYSSKDIVKEMNNYIDTCQARANTEPRLQGRRKRAQTLFTAEGLKAANETATQCGPDFSVERKIEQLKLHATLHQLFESRQLKPNMMSYYLSKTVEYRANLLKYLNNPDDKSLPDGFHESIVSTRLAKFPPGWIILADRGFAGNCYMYPNLNHHITPHFLSGRAQFESEEIATDREICQRRYTCEVAFARFTDIKALRDVVPYQYNGILSSIVQWGHAYNNLQQPLKKPHDYDNYIQALTN
jgi:DDE superfamily endonuclease